MKELVEGIVISERSYGETSKIINILTKEYGIIGCMAKGAKQLKSNLRVGATKLAYGNFCITKKDDKLSLLTSVDVINNFSSIRKDIYKTSYAVYLLELTEQVIKQNNDDKIYKLLIDALEKINQNFDVEAITSIIELKYLEYLGVLPVLDSCTICGDKTSITTLSGSRGGYICKNCRTTEKKVSEKTIKLIRMLYYVDIKKIENLEISDEVKKEITNFLDNYYDQYTGLYLKTKHFLKKIVK